MTITVERTGQAVEVITPNLRITVSTNKPRALVASPDGREWSNLWLLGGADRVECQDTAFDISDTSVEEHADCVTVTTTAHSTAWHSRRGVLRILASGLEHYVEVTGNGRLDSCTLLGGRAALSSGASGFFRSSIQFSAVLSPAPTEPLAAVRPAHHAAALSSYGDADSGRMHAVFSPPPLVFGLGRDVAPHPTALPEGDWLSCSFRCPVEEATFEQVRYEPLDGGFRLILDYAGHTTIDGTWRSPTVVLAPAASAVACIQSHRDDLLAHHCAPQPSHRASPDWHLEPIFCGWGAQCARARHQRSAGDGGGLIGGGTAQAAPAFSSRGDYDEWLALLERAGISPGTVVVDDRWQDSYGLNTVDEKKWPDLKGWIAQQHANGRRVLLWWKAWDAEGLPAEECVRLPDGTPLCVDPGSSAYRQRLREMVSFLLGPDGLDADGLKVDFTQRAPSGQDLEHESTGWGFAQLWHLVTDLHEAAHQAKSDALVVTHTIHPWFGDACDMIRLNDLFERGADGERVSAVDQLEFRARVARAALPHLPRDTDQWPMATRDEWLDYIGRQPLWGVPALYYLESIDNSGEAISDADLALVRITWEAYRAAL